MTVRPKDNGVARNYGCFKKRLFLGVVVRTVLIEPRELFLRFAPDAAEPLFKHDLIIMYPLEGRAERSRFVYDIAGCKLLVGVVCKARCLVGERFCKALVKGLSFPVRCYLLGDDPCVLFGNVERGIFSCRQLFDSFLEDVAVKLGVQYPVASGLSAPAD